MKSVKRMLLLGLLFSVLFALPVTVLANKQIYKAVLLTENELHEVVGSNAHGAGIFGFAPGSTPFQLTVNNVSGPVTGAHIHGPATESENGPVVVTLCGGPPPAVMPVCTMDGPTTLKISGVIGNHLQPGITNAQFQDWLEDGLLYINVHTDLNPAGEVRGQLYPH